MLEKIISNLKNLQTVKYNLIYAKEVIETATKMYNDGWDNLEDGIVVLSKGDLVAIKVGNKIEKYEMKDFNINMGKLNGDFKNAKNIGSIELNDKNKQTYLAQTIITKYYTVRSC